MDALRELRIIAVREALGEVVGSDVIIETALQALLEGVESPNLPLLAGLGRQEESEAHDLFRRVADELDIAPPSPVDTESARWELVRWACEAVIEGKITPAWGGSLIWHDGWNELGCPDSVQGVVGAVSEFDDWSPSWEVDREHLRQQIVAEVERLLRGPWPPVIADALEDAVALWRLSPGYTADVIDAAVACLVGGADTPSLRLLAGASATDSQFVLEPLITETVAELGLLWRREPTQFAAMRAVARRYNSGVISAHDLTHWAHEFIGHEGDERCQVFVELDDIFDVEMEHDALDLQQRPEVDAFLAGRPSPMEAQAVRVNPPPTNTAPTRFKFLRFGRRKSAP